MSKTVAIEIELLDRISGGLDRVNKKMDALKEHSDKAKKGLSGLENMSDRLKQSLMGLGLAFSMKGLVAEVANVRGQFQQLEVAFNTMLGSADKAEALMAQLVRTAAITPFDLEGVAQGAKQLLAYGMEAENVNETLTRLGDIAAGLSMPLNDLVYLYGTTMAQGRLYTQDLNQFTGRGIPMIEELAKVFGVAESKVKDLVEAGRVGFPEVQKVIENLTGEGSKFGGLMEEQSKTITGQISNIEDAIASMYQINANYLEMAHAQARYWNKHKSWGHYWKGFTGDQTEWIKQNVKGDFNGSIWSLSPEEMKKLLGNVGIAEYIKNTGKGGYGAKVLDKLQDYAAQAGKLEELTDSWRETVTQISFDSMKDSFMSNLMDMKKGSKDFAEGFATDMQKALLSYSMEDLVNGKLKKLYDDWAKTISEKNGELTDKDIEDFNRRYDEIVAEGLKRRDEWAKVTGYEDASGTSQSAKAGGFSAMTQEQGTKLDGMFVSGLQHWSSMDERLETVAERMSVAESHLARIAENTGTSAEHLGEIKEEIRKIVRDGLKVK